MGSGVGAGRGVALPGTVAPITKLPLLSVLLSTPGNTAKKSPLTPFRIIVLPALLSVLWKMIKSSNLSSPLNPIKSSPWRKSVKMSASPMSGPPLVTNTGSVLPLIPGELNRPMTKTSLPSPPETKSLPPSPQRTSLPAPPSMMSSPAPPKTMSSPSPAKIVSALAFP